MTSDQPLAAGFEPVSYERWRESAVGDGDRRPVTEIEDGIEVDWLYTPADEIAPDPAGVPGRAPFVRGSRAGRTWQIRQEQAHPQRAAANRNLLEDLAGGATEIAVVLDRAARHGLAPGSAGFDSARGEGGVAVSTVDDLALVLDGVLLDVAPISLDAGPNSIAAAALLWALWRRNGIPDDEAGGSFRMDPIGSLARDGQLPSPPEDQVAAAGGLAARVAAALPGVRSLAVDSRAYVDAGATPAWELAVAASTGVEYLRAADGAGLAPAEAASQIEFTLQAGADQFTEIAKFRAMRRIWARILEASGAPPEARRSATYGRSSARAYAAVDPWVNMLRGTSAAFAAGIGGADGVTVTPFDRPLGEPGKLGRRIARNTQLILQEESSLGRLADPAAGSWYVESLTDALARAAWERFGSIEAEGGALAALRSGMIATGLAELGERRRRELIHRDRILTGVNNFPLLGEEGVLPDPVDHEALVRLEEARLAERPAASGLDRLEAASPPERLESAVELAAEGARIDELAAAMAGEGYSMPPLPRLRDADPFERLRVAALRHERTGGQRPRIFLACLGPIARHVARANWAKSFFEVGGIEAVESGQLEGAAAQGSALAQGRFSLAAVCAGPSEEPGDVAEAVEALRGSGAEWVCLAEPTPEQAEAAAADRVVADGDDMVEVLTGALGRLGVEVDE